MNYATINKIVYISPFIVRVDDEQRKIRDEDIKEMRLHGFGSPIRVSKRYKAITGKHKVLVARYLQMSTIPCIVYNGRNQSKKSKEDAKVRNQSKKSKEEIKGRNQRKKQNNKNVPAILKWQELDL